MIWIRFGFCRQQFSLVWFLTQADWFGGVCVRRMYICDWFGGVCVRQMYICVREW